MHVYWKSFGVFLLFSLTAAATFAQTVPTGPRFTPLGLDGKLFELARQVPGFGGYFFDENGDLNVYLTDLSQERAARAAVTKVARNRGERSEQPWSRPAEIVVRRGNFDFAQLHRWRAHLNTALPQFGVRLIDIDEAKNRIFVGVADEAAKSDVLTLVDQLGLPQNAVIVGFAGEVSRATSINDFVRPLVGGLAIWQTGIRARLA